MNFPPFLLLVGAGLLNALGTSAMKYATAYKKADGASTLIFYLLIAGAMALYGISFPIFATGLSRVRLSIAQPLFSATTFATATAVSLLLLKETISLPQALGMGAILAGIILVVR